MIPVFAALIIAGVLALIGFGIGYAVGNMRGHTMGHIHAIIDPETHEELAQAFGDILYESALKRIKP